MKQFALPVLTLGFLLVTSAVLYGSGWVTPHTNQNHTGKASSFAARADRPSESLLHFQHGGPMHWRSCMLQCVP